MRSNEPTPAEENECEMKCGLEAIEHGAMCGALVPPWNIICGSIVSAEGIKCASECDDPYATVCEEPRTGTPRSGFLLKNTATVPISPGECVGKDQCGNLTGVMAPGDTQWFQKWPTCDAIHPAWNIQRYLTAP